MQRQPYKLLKPAHDPLLSFKDYESEEDLSFSDMKNIDEEEVATLPMR